MEERFWHRAYAPQLPPSIDYEDVTLPAGLARVARDYPGNTALIMMGKKMILGVGPR